MRVPKRSAGLGGKPQGVDGLEPGVVQLSQSLASAQYAGVLSMAAAAVKEEEEQHHRRRSAPLQTFFQRNDVRQGGAGGAGRRKRFSD